MSTFSGKIQEIPYISVDRFDGENLESQAYFLSHCHSDHMRGLTNKFVNEQLVENSKYLYASRVTCAILKKNYPNIESNLKELDVNVSYIISLDNNTFTTTLIPAGHCPGSVMFLFESHSTVLYTGDYRIHKNDLRKFNVFRGKTVDAVYLDTTFFLEEYPAFPARRDSLRELVRIARDWLDRGQNHHVNLIVCANYGYEHLIRGISSELKTPVHVNQAAFEFYSLIPELDRSVTRDARATRLHSKCRGFREPVCVEDQPNCAVKSIKISAWQWRGEALAGGISSLDDDGLHRLCYSTHASYEEGVALIEFLRPKRIEANVERGEPQADKAMRELIERHLGMIGGGEEEEERAEEAPKLFELGGKRGKREREQSFGSSSDEEAFEMPKRHTWWNGGG
ncbi:unnamed protein product [Phyllotreta striolata]|uniref:Uncharacterized protein n=1 Tax=Phyllotreta striolata TaxID=444603 RepID=A0A9N9XR99_PHYSR|nr:unnamed protein product [Phyllotreta striolata]